MPTHTPIVASNIDFIQDDGGRAEAGYKGQAGDCVTRALAILTGRSYRECYADLADAEHRYQQARQSSTGRKPVRSARNGIHRDTYETVFAAYGLTKVKLPPGPRPTYAEAYSRYGDCIVSTVKHLAALVDSALRDTHDTRYYRMPGDRAWHPRKARSVYVPGAGPSEPPRQYVTSPWSCTCPDAYYRRRVCKHMAAAMEADAALRDADLLDAAATPRCDCAGILFGDGDTHNAYCATITHRRTP